MQYLDFFTPILISGENVIYLVFVERQKLYRLVYSLIFSRKNFEKKSKYNPRANIFFSLDFFEKLKGQKSQSVVNSLW